MPGSIAPLRGHGLRSWLPRLLSLEQRRGCRSCEWVSTFRAAGWRRRPLAGVSKAADEAVLTRTVQLFSYQSVCVWERRRAVWSGMPSECGFTKMWFDCVVQHVADADSEADPPGSDLS